MFRLGLDLGTNSLGWCLYENNSIKALGVRIFSNGRDPNSKDSLAVERRTARAMRRRRDRYLQRRSALLGALVAHGLMPTDESKAKLLADRDPYDLRVRALTEALHLHEIGRAIFHLNQRRGFKSNRKTDRRNSDKDDGKIRQAELELDRAMLEVGAGITLGQFLQSFATKRVRMKADGTGYEFYPQRRHYEYEFNRIWQEQAKHHPTVLSEDAREHIHKIIFHQRDLKKQVVGKCTFLDELRLPKAHPLFQERRLYEEVNQLRIRENGEERSLTIDERNSVVLALKQPKRQDAKVAFKVIAKLLRLDEGARFNKETETRKDLLGDEVSAEMSHKSRFGARWYHFDDSTQWKIIQHLMDEENPIVLLDWLRFEFSLEKENSEAIADAHLPEGHGRLGETASRLILRALKQDVIDYDEAVRRNEKILGHHSDRRPDEGRDELPYYGEILDRDLKPGTSNPSDPPEIRFGRISNPTVHIGLNQLKRLVNDIIAVHGRPDEVVIELARELKQNDRQREEANRKIAKNTRDAEERSRKLRAENIPDTGANRMLLRQWKELNPDEAFGRFCPYCAKPISIRQLFNSSLVDVDHILPYSRTLDDSPANRLVVHTSCNRQKDNQTPFEKWGADPDRWATILEQVSRLHPSKQWRFLPNAMERFEKEGGFAERQLKDTQYLSTLAGKYLGSLYGKTEGRRVYVIPGKMTALLRRVWGLNSILPDHNQVENPHSDGPKNRLDHRHNTIDAAVVGVTTHGLIKNIATAAARAEHHQLDRLFKDLDHPWPKFRDDLKVALDGVTVSHRPDHGLKPKAKLKQAPPPHMSAGRLHNDTAYGFTGQINENGVPLVVHRTPIGSIKREQLIKGGSGRKPSWIVDDKLRNALAIATRGTVDKAFLDAVRVFAKDHSEFRGIRGARIIEALNVIPIRDADGRAYKGYKGDSNYRYDVWELPDGKWVTNWKDGAGQELSSIISMFDAHRQEELQRPHPAARKVLSLHRDDIIAFDRGRGRELMRVVKFSPEQLALAPLQETNVDARSRDKDSGFRYTFPAPSRLKEWQTRQVIVDPLGRIRDPGFPARKTRRSTRKSS